MVRVRVQWDHAGRRRAFMVGPGPDGWPVTLSEEPGRVQGIQRPPKASRKRVRGMARWRFGLAALLDRAAARLRSGDWCGCAKRKRALTRAVSACYRLSARMLEKCWKVYREWVE